MKIILPLSNKNLKNYILNDILEKNFKIKKELERIFLRQDVFDRYNDQTKIHKINY